MSRGQTWSREEVQSLLEIWSDKYINYQLSTTHKNAQIFSVFSRQMTERGFNRSGDQCRVKTKKLRQQYLKVKHALNKPGCSSLVKDQFVWYDAMDKILGMKHDPADLLDAVDFYEDPMESPQYEEHIPVEILPEQILPEQILPEQPVSPLDCPIPTKKRKTSIVTQVNNMINATMGTLRDMDRDMQAQEDARLQRLMDHEKNMQRSLIQEMLSLHRTISAENHKRHLELVDRIMTKVPRSSSQPAL